MSEENENDKSERLDRELIELLNELRVALPGVQVLFGFLLTVPFTQRFQDVSNLQRTVFFLTFVSAAVATALLIAPSAQHRLQWRQHDKERLLRASNQLAIAGLAFLALAMAGAVFVVTDMLYQRSLTAVVAATTAALYAVVWFVVPIARRLTRG